MTPAMVPVAGGSGTSPADDTRTGVAYTGVGISCWHPANCGYCVWKNCVHAFTCASVARVAGTVGNPILQVGGEQEAVMVPAPAETVVSPQLSVQDEATFNTVGCEAVQVNGILVRTTPPFVFGKVLLPITSVIVATAVCGVPFDTTKFVRPDPAAPISRPML